MINSWNEGNVPIHHIYAMIATVPLVLGMWSCTVVERQSVVLACGIMPVIRPVHTSAVHKSSQFTSGLLTNHVHYWMLMIHTITSEASHPQWSTLQPAKKNSSYHVTALSSGWWMDGANIERVDSTLPNSDWVKLDRNLVKTCWASTTCIMHYVAV